MSHLKNLEMQLAAYTDFLYNQGYVDNQFKKMQKVQHIQDRRMNRKTEYVKEMVSVYSVDTERNLNEMCNELKKERVDFHKLDSLVNEIKLGSLSVGARKVNIACFEFREYSEAENMEGYLEHVHLLKNEHVQLMSQLENMFEMEEQVLASGGSIPNPMK